MPDQVRHLYIIQNSLEYKKQTKFFKSAPYALLCLHHSVAYVIEFIKSNSYYVLVYILFIWQFDLSWHKRRIVAVIPVNLTHQTRTDTRVLALRDEKDSLYWIIRRYILAGMINHALVFKIIAASQTSYNIPGAKLFAEVNSKIRVETDLHFRIFLKYLLAPILPICKVECTMLIWIIPYRNPNLIKQIHRSKHYGFMKICNRIKSPRKYRYTLLFLANNRRVFHNIINN